jgi:hypothetical protein
MKKMEPAQISNNQIALGISGHDGHRSVSLILSYRSIVRFDLPNQQSLIQSARVIFWTGPQGPIDHSVQLCGCALTPQDMAGRSPLPQNREGFEYPVGPVN